MQCEGMHQFGFGIPGIRMYAVYSSTSQTCPETASQEKMGISQGCGPEFSTATLTVVVWSQSRKTNGKFPSVKGRKCRLLTSLAPGSTSSSLSLFSRQPPPCVAGKGPRSSLHMVGKAKRQSLIFISRKENVKSAFFLSLPLSRATRLSGVVPARCRHGKARSE